MTKLKYGGRVVKLYPYNTSMEKELILYNALNDDKDIDDVIEILQYLIHLEDSEHILSENEKFLILYKLRSISVGDIVSIKQQCVNCKEVIEKEISVDDLVQGGNFPESEYDIKEAFSEDVNDYVSFDMEELEIDEYEELEEFILKYKVKFNFIQENKCHKCQHINNVNIKDKDFLIDNLSEDSISNYFKLISDMVFHGKFTKTDIDNMMPFERNIYLGLLNQQLEELNK